MGQGCDAHKAKDTPKPRAVQFVLMQWISSFSLCWFGLMPTVIPHTKAWYLVVRSTSTIV